MRGNNLIQFCIAFSSFTVVLVYSVTIPVNSPLVLQIVPQNIRLSYLSSNGSSSGLIQISGNEEPSLINSPNDLETGMPKVVLLYLLFGPLLVNSDILKALQLQLQTQKPKEPSEISQSSSNSSSSNISNGNMSSSAECYTRKGHEGNCTTFKECFPMEYYGEDGEEMQPDRNALVEEMFATSKSPGCVSRLNSVGDIEKIICCPVSKEFIPPIPPNKIEQNSTEMSSTSEFETTMIPEMVNSTNIAPETSTVRIPSSTNVNDTSEMVTMLPGSGSTTGESGKMNTTTESSATSTSTTEVYTTSSTSTTTERSTTWMNPTVRPPFPSAGCGRVKVYSTSTVKSSKVTGGREAFRGEFPWMVAIFGKNGKLMCGGTLLNSQYVLTASHCLSTYNEYDVAHLTVTIGDHNIQTTKEGPHQSRKIVQLILHRGFDIRTYHNDVALMRLDRPVEFNEYVQPVCLPKANSSQNIEGQEVVVAGWGRDRSYGSLAPTLRKVNMPVWKYSECQNVFNLFAPGRLTQTNICAGDGRRNKDACIGDSGGPLMQNLDGVWHQIGIVSWGKGCGSFPGVYTRLDQFVHWIEKNMR